MYRPLPKHRHTTESDTSSTSDIAPAQEQKLSAMGPLQYTRSPLQGSAPPPPPAGNPHTLPLPLQNGIAALSGYDMRSVRVHRNSTQPAQHGALAFAQGQDIHLGPGQEQHLPHEAWHLVQQAQGRVQANMQMAGVAINDDPALEHEADLMGQRALQYRGQTAQTVHSLGPGLGMQRKVMQKMSTQITLDKVGNIEQVVMRGRPPRVFSNSMGDHTTAFVVHQEGLAIALEGQSLPDAVEIVSALADKLESLPGYRYMQINDDKDDAGTNVGKRFLHEYQRLQTNLEEAEKVDDDTDMQMHYLQQAINYYLAARELVPFSTINVGEKSKGRSGRGHGESRPISFLSTYERAFKQHELDKTKKKNYSKSSRGRTQEAFLSNLEEELPFAMPELFDFGSGGSLALETNPDLFARMTGGITMEGENEHERMGVFWKQHKISMKSNFPLSWDKSKDKLASEKIESIIITMRNREFLNLSHDINVEIDQIYQAVTSLQKPETLMHGEKISQIRVTELAAIFRKLENLLQLLENINDLNISSGDDSYRENILQLEKKLVDSLSMSEHVHRNILDSIRNSETELEKAILEKSAEIVTHEKGEEQDLTLIKEKPIKEINDLKRVLAGNPLSGIFFFNGEIDEKKLSTLETEQESSKRKKTQDLKLSTLTSAMAPLATQVTLNPDHTVAGLNAKGRPQSPFIGTMGAHTTAWVTHLDRINSLIKGKSIKDAIAAMKVLGGKVNTFAAERALVGQGRNSKSLYSGAQKWMNALMKDTKTVSLQHLQAMISAILSFYNLIPGVSMEKIDTRGKGEAKHRRTLLNYEAYGEGSKEDLVAAIKGLFDSKVGGMLYDNHLAIIADAYPDSHAFAIKGGVAKKKIERPSDKTTETDENGEEDDYDDEQTLNAEQIKDLKNQYASDLNAWNINNCLINAITDAAGIARASEEQVIAIRTEIGAAAGEMLFASPRILDLILTELGLLERGVLVLNIGSIYTDQSTLLGENPLLIYHDGINHFQALNNGPRKDKDKATLFGQRFRHAKRKRPRSPETELYTIDPKVRKMSLKSNPSSGGIVPAPTSGSDLSLVDDPENSSGSESGEEFS